MSPGITARNLSYKPASVKFSLAGAGLFIDIILPIQLGQEWYTINQFTLLSCVNNNLPLNT